MSSNIYKYKKGKKSAAKNKTSITKIVKNVLNKYSETYHSDHLLGGLTINQTISTTKLTPIVQGIADTQRIGDEIQCLTMEAHATIVGDLSSSVPVNGRIVFWMYKMIDTTPPTNNFIFEYGTNFATAHDSPFYMDRRSQYTILKDFRFQISPNTNGTSVISSSGNYRSLRFKRKINKPIRFIGGGTSGSNQIYVTYFSNVITTAPVFQGYIRFKLKDY